PVYAIGGVLHDEFEQLRDAGGSTLAQLKSFPRRLRRSYPTVPPANQQPLGHSEAETRGLVSRPADLTHQIGDNAERAPFGCVQLLVPVPPEHDRDTGSRYFCLV